MLAEAGSIVEVVNVDINSLLGVCLTRQNPPRKPLPLEAGIEGFNTGIEGFNTGIIPCRTGCAVA